MAIDHQCGGRSPIGHVRTPAVDQRRRFSTSLPIITPRSTPDQRLLGPAGRKRRARATSRGS